jgi:hypothetical protein
MSAIHPIATEQQTCSSVAVTISQPKHGSDVRYVGGSRRADRRQAGGSGFGHDHRQKSLNRPGDSSV